MIRHAKATEETASRVARHNEAARNGDCTSVVLDYGLGDEVLIGLLECCQHCHRELLLSRVDGEKAYRVCCSMRQRLCPSEGITGCPYGETRRTPPRRGPERAPESGTGTIDVSSEAPGEQNLNVAEYW
jgi:hypothetical protein